MTQPSADRTHSEADTHDPPAPPSPGRAAGRTPLEPLGLASSYRATTGECDLIMKGGITSGIAYPLATCRLATRYRFRQVGGASAGAIAAALAGAAEYQRRSAAAAGPGLPSPHGEPGAGFVALSSVPTQLGSTLATLFQPARALRRPYQALVGWTEPGWSRPRKLAETGRQVIAAAPGLFALVLVLALLPGFLVGLWLASGPAGPDWVRISWSLLVWLPGALAVALLACAVWMVRDTLRKLPANGYGFVRGRSEDPTGPPSLTDWLTEHLDAVAGLAPGEGPLTFGHLYGAAASETFRELRLDESSATASPLQRRRFEPELDLQMMTSCITLGRPYAFPFRTKVFHYCPDCWAQYFPESVLATLAAKSKPAGPVTQQVGGRRTPIDQRCGRHGAQVRSLPSAPDIPVIVGVRMSLSFPGLFSGVPLWMVDFTRAAGHEQLVEVWFSDGGITNNFPVHFFDRLLPGRPTFGITLTDPHPDFPDQKVWRPTKNGSGILARPRQISSMLGFVRAVADTMQNWVDQTAASAPGFRDRIVELRTFPGEGGLNLKMQTETIEEVSERGDQAAQQFEDFDFDDHRWVRYRTALAGLSDLFDAWGQGYPEYRRLAEDYSGTGYRLGKARRAAVQQTADGLAATATSWQAAGYPATQENVPHPRPALRSVLRP